MSNNFCVILTCTIDVKGIAFMERSNIGDRFNDYCSAFEMWLKGGGADNIVFVENSGYDLSYFKELALKFPHKNVEFISFDGQDFDRALGKGYGEMLALKRVFDCSKLLSEKGWFVKVNGRYYIPKFEEVAKVIGAKPDIMCDLSKNLTWADSRVFGGGRNFFQSHLFPELLMVNDTKGLYFEHALVKATLRGIADGLSWRLAPFVAIVGVSGTANEVYKRSHFKEFVRWAMYGVKKFLLAR
ncbi:hypothetical protein J2Y83_001514 [Pseudomonas marginalis]|uniref:hypothetical protein n=1 Tax=Pseudomonas marginalis TaxID=298 RepID=UPI00209C84AD|nr:hypothetical protein [Pseudomonas marginalis]MCP1505541.1 hypothetical protein [Pseudomonas marginalis]MCP1523045.1 hypothetical protein [Pseudomonas marginalis]MDQ0497637.1 hypothetical protein [Pseudomonas marginalis]